MRGPIGTFLKLPAPLDTVIYLLRNEDGALRLSFNVQVEGSGVSTSAITAEVAKVLGEQIAVAVARAPLRILRSFTDITGATGGERTEDFKTTWLRFDPSETIPPPIEWRGVRNLSEELASDSQLVVTVQHTFAKADIDQVSRLANPTPEQCLEMADRIRQQKLELGRQRGIAAAEARALVFFGRKEECDAATDRVRALDRQIGEADAALGSFLDMLRTGSERQCERRTRNAALALANERLLQVRTALEKAGIAVERIRLRPVRMEPEQGAERSFVTLLPRRQL